jgi:hypothetical protein
VFDEMASLPFDCLFFLFFGFIGLTSFRTQNHFCSTSSRRRVSIIVIGHSVLLSAERLGMIPSLISLSKVYSLGLDFDFNFVIGDAETMEDEDTSHIRSLKRVREVRNARPISLVISK